MKARAFAFLLGGVALAAYALFLLRQKPFSVGGSDSSGYFNSAKLMEAGTLVARPEVGRQ